MARAAARSWLKHSISALGAASILLACAEQSTPCTQVAGTARPLRGGTTTGGPTDPASRSAIVALAASTAAVPDELCSGVLVDPSIVLSAAHCTRTLPMDAKVWIGATLKEGSSIEIDELDESADHDLALVHLRGPVESSRTRPIPLQLTPPKAGSTVTLAGYGLAEHDELGTRRFVDERVQSVTSEYIVVDGEGKRGACGGDSGGPLLVRDESAGARVVGVLSLGSISCLEIDLYQRLDVAEAWLQMRLGQLACEAQN